MLRTESYIYGNREFIEAGEIYYFGELWDGDGDGEELLKSGAIAIRDEVVNFEVLEFAEDLLQAEVKIC